MKSILFNLTYQLTQEYINRRYAHWRKLRSLLFDLSHNRWPQHLIDKIEHKLLPLIHKEQYIEAKELAIELNEERIKYKYSLPLYPEGTCPKCKKEVQFELIYSKLQVFAVCKLCNAYFSKYESGTETKWFEFIEELER